MKKALMTLALIATTTSYAKLAVYSNTSALQAVLSSTETMSKLSSQMLGAELTSTQIISAGEGLTKNFTIRMTYTSKTPIGDRSCYADVAVISRPGTVKLPNGAAIGVNELVVGKISKNICQK